jgi:hypothetical protein
LQVLPYPITASPARHVTPNILSAAINSGRSSRFDSEMTDPGFAPRLFIAAESISDTLNVTERQSRAGPFLES